MEQALTNEIEAVCRATVATGDRDLSNTLKLWQQERTDPVPAGRTFNGEMAPSTVVKLSAEWHERAADTQVAGVEFPEPWYEGDTVGDYRIEPVNTANKLGRYAKQLRNCAGVYAHHVAQGSIFMYVVFAANTPQDTPVQRPEAMFELKNNNGYRSLGQLNGPRNQSVQSELKAAVRGWLEDKRASIGGAS